METSVLSRISRLREMTVADLRDEWERLYGAPAPAKHRDFLFRRLAYRVQELADGGLPDSAQARLEELGQDAWTRVTSRRQGAHEADPVAPPKVTQIRDHRLSVGTVISKVYKSNELTVVVREDGLEFDGSMFGSLTAIAKRVTGSRSINGKLFWGISQRNRKR